MSKISIYSKLKQNRPELSDSSLKTYTSIIYNLYKNLFDDDNINLDKFNNANKIIKLLKDKDVNVRKTILSSLFVLTNNDKYRIKMLKDIKDYNKEIDKQELTETQKNNWIDSETIKNKLDELSKNFNSTNIQKAQEYVILSLLSGEYIPPRRLKDYTEFKIKNIDHNKDNYIKGSYLYFNNYKGSDTKGLQKILLPQKLKNIINKWIKMNQNEYLLFDKNNNKLTSIKLNQRLNKIFGSKISVNSLRHSFLTEKHKDKLDDIDNLKSDMKMMGSSILQAKTYIKKLD